MRPLDPHRALAQDPLATPLLEAPQQEPALSHIRAHDPRARLEQAAQALHGRPAQFTEAEPVEAEPPKRREL